MNSPRPHLPLLGFAAYSGTGKTTLLEALIPMLTEAGLRLGVLKHAHHDFDVDIPGKDSYRLRKAGASQMLIASRNRHVLMTETPDAEAEFNYLLSRFDSEKLDIILVEGCKNITFPKVELHRKELNKPWLYPNDNNIIAIAADESVESALPQLNINDLATIAKFVINYANTFGQEKPTSACCDTLSPALLSVEQGRQAILASVSALSEIEYLALPKIYNRVLGKDLSSPVNVPSYRNSAMDGFAIRSDDLNREQYQIVAEVLAGDCYSGVVGPGQTVKIMTGAAVPQGADTVIMREQALICGESVTFGDTKIKAGQNVRQAGEDLAQGQKVFSQGQRLNSPEMGMIASLGMDTVPVYRKLKVAIFSTGDEVQAPGTLVNDSRIFDSNRYTLMGLLAQLGCETIDLGIIADNEQAMIDALRRASSTADVVLTSGGVSVGDADFIKSALKSLGSIEFWRINMRPGRPLAFGNINHKPVFGLPGNPVAVMVSFINFVEPALRKMQGEENWQPLKVNAIATEELRSRQGRTEFTRGIYSINQYGQLMVQSTGKQGSGILRSMSEANCLIEISPAVDTVKSGESVTIIPLQGRI
ncbi:MAG: bifunctional molybdopterin-guanine dinucleotide biosynthesis adaptor protein MobB/molybdopterin molybdotransferase MoeA [Vibrio sp.]|uniref:bifunctional molybdopterin-guanine dinucleotide biosynthesis adaptor protein MobB/molybdopterin molybdotransferase MoeA n=1 Tax=Vibrio sp. TaxID=678 RepID=UPI003A8686E7